MNKKRRLLLSVVLAIIVISMLPYGLQSSITVSATGAIGIGLDVGGISAYATPYNPGDEVVEQRSATSKTFYLGDGEFQLITTGDLHYQDGEGNWQEIDNAWEPAVAPWDWQMVQDAYSTYVLNDFTYGQVLKFEYQGSTVAFQPMALEWLGIYGGIEQISMPQSVAASINNIPQEPIAGMEVHTGTIRWNDAYGSGRHFQWNTTPGKLEKLLTLDVAPPSPPQYMIDQGSTDLRLNFIFAPSSDLSIYIDGALWDKKAAVTTERVIEFRSGGKTLWYFTPVSYWDSSEDSESYGGITTVRKVGNSLYVSTLVPYEWLSEAVYPVYIDPTLTVQPSTQDTWLNYTAQTSNYGSGTVFYCGYGNTPTVYRAILEFNISSLPSDVEIQSATFTLYVSTVTTSGDYWFSRMLWVGTDWVETQATWILRKTGVNWATAGCGSSGTDFTNTNRASGTISATGSKDITVTSQVIDSYNLDLDYWAVRIVGKIDYGDTNIYFGACTKEHSTITYRPKLVINYAIPPTTTILSATSITSSTARINAEVLADGGAACEGRFSWGKIEKEDTFEWGVDTDPLSDDGGGIDWTIVAAGDSKVEIETTAPFAGTRCARLYRDGTNNVIAYFSQTPITATQSIELRVRKDDTSTFQFLHGDDTYCIQLKIENDEKIYYYDGAWKDTGAAAVSIDTWYLLSIRNADWDAATYDIYLNGDLIKSAADMRVLGTISGLIQLYNSAGTSSLWIDNVRVLANRTTTAFANGLTTSSPFYSDLVSLSSGTKHVYEAQTKNSAGEGLWSSEATFVTLLIDIAVSPVTYNFGAVAASSTPSTTTTYFTITNISNTQTDQTISVTTSTWSGGVTWAHSDTCTPGTNTAGLKANRGGTWGTGDVIVKYNATWNYIYENCPATTNYSFGLKLWAPTVYTDGVTKQIVVRITAVAG